MIWDFDGTPAQRPGLWGIPAILVRSPGEARHRADGLDGAVAILLSRGVR